MHGPPVETTTVEDNETKTICVPPEPEVTDRPTPQKLAQCKPKVLPYYYDGPSCTGCNDARPFSEQSPYKAAVHEFCHGGYNFKAKSTGDRDATKWGAALDIFTDSGQENPDTGLPPLCAIHNVLWDGIKRPDSKDLCHADRSWGGDSLFRVAVVLSKDQSGGCGILQDYVIPTGDKCEEMLNIVVDDCIVGEKDDETGGYFLDRSPNGCWEWWIYSKNIL
jgi:hypothetical protein